MLRWAAIASSRAATRLAVASSRPLIVHPPMAPVGAATIVSTPLLLSSIARLPSDFSATRGYARGRSKPVSSEEEEEDDEDLVDDDDDDEDDDAEELDGDEDFDDADDFDDEDDSDDGEYRRSDRY